MAIFHFLKSFSRCYKKTASDWISRILGRNAPVKYEHPVNKRASIVNTKLRPATKKIINSLFTGHFINYWLRISDDEFTHPWAHLFAHLCQNWVSIWKKCHGNKFPIVNTIQVPYSYYLFHNINHGYTTLTSIRLFSLTVVFLDRNFVVFFPVIV